MKSSEVRGTGPIVYRLDLLAKKILVLMMVFLLSFSTEMERENIRLAQAYFHRGYIEYQQGNYPDAIAVFSRAFLADRSGYYGELSYLYIGISYAKQSYRTGKRGGVLSAIAYLNMYPYYYKNPTYLFLQREFIGDAYLLLGFYDRAKDVFFNLYRDTNREDYLLKFLYADSLSKGLNSQLLDSIDPETLVEGKYLYHLVKGFYAFNVSRYPEALRELSEARTLNRYLEDDPEFLYRYAVSSYMEKDWRSAAFYFEQLDRKDIYRKYLDSVNYYLALIYLMSGNYADAKRRVMNISSSGGLKASLLFSQLWLYPEFLEKYAKELGDYKRILQNISWTYLNSVYSNPAILGLYYYTLKEKRIQDPDILRLKRLSLPKEIIFEDIRIETGPMVSALGNLMSGLNPYVEDAGFLLSLYKVNPDNYTLLFGYEKLARAVVYLGDTTLKNIPERLEEPLRSFLLGQLLLLEGSEEGLRMIESYLQGLTGEDRLEALFIRGIYRKDIRLLEGLVEQELPQRVLPYLEPSLLELGDFYYSRGQYEKAKSYYRRYLEIAEESDLYWLTAYKLAKSGELTGDEETIQWVVKMAQGKDNIISRVIIILWG
ncbi:tetratricopeptide repeat protein [Hydrogenobacter sp. T-2]|uniref:tetratricopeptide repeat protein n=1 Tax=Pampinifervens diazotrophicum TaxID=1632018 RepID=UPI002B257AAE|nr:tetratricopeptide repeat protein [Hydrogenobacter sp. T-2]WPM31648.1 tetratricopeptide repeat protein [Hydrogenobacter sp. T-2]